MHYTTLTFNQINLIMVPRTTKELNAKKKLKYIENFFRASDTSRGFFWKKILQ